MSTRADNGGQEAGPVTVRLDEQIRVQLEKLAQENDRTLSAEIRRALRLHVEREAIAA